MEKRPKKGEKEKDFRNNK